MPWPSILYSAETEIVSSAAESTEIRVINTPIRLCRNTTAFYGRYHVMVTKFRGRLKPVERLAITRWREDTTCDNWGTFCYIRIRRWHLLVQYLPANSENAQSYEATFTQGRVDFRRRDGHMDTHTEIVVSSEDNIEIRRVHITTLRRTRTIDVTSYAEIVLNSSAADVLHPAFTSFVRQRSYPREAHIKPRRPRSVHENRRGCFISFACMGRILLRYLMKQTG